METHSVLIRGTCQLRGTCSPEKWGAAEQPRAAAAAAAEKTQEGQDAEKLLSSCLFALLTGGQHRNCIRGQGDGDAPFLPDVTGVQPYLLSTRVL